MAYVQNMEIGYDPTSDALLAHADELSVGLSSRTFGTRRRKQAHHAAIVEIRAYTASFIKSMTVQRCDLVVGDAECRVRVIELTLLLRDCRFDFRKKQNCAAEYGVLLDNHLACRRCIFRVDVS